MPRRRTRRAALLVAATVAALAGCGGAPAPVPTAAPAGGGTSAVCDSMHAIDQVPTPEAGPGRLQPPAEEVMAFARRLAPLLASARAAAPPDLARAIDTLTAVFTVAQRSGTPPNFDDPTVDAAYNSVEAWVHASCGFQKVDLTAAGLRLDGVPATVAAGPTSIAVTNPAGSGRLVVLLAVRPKDQSLTAEALRAVPAEQLFGSTDVAPSAAVARPGTTGGVIVDLTPGRWFLVDPVGDTGKPSAYQQGMLAEITVA